MKKLLLLLLLSILFIPSVRASTSTAYEYVLMDMNSGRVLASKDKDNPRLIASITKIMTAVLAIESNRLEEIVTVDDTILKSYGSGIYIQVGEEISLKDLVYGLMMRSGNDAAMMIAAYVSGTQEEFVKKMNNKAKEIGMKNTTFVNPSGLDNTDGGNYSTAYDMALLTRYAMQYEEYREIVKTKNYTVKSNYKTYVWTNKNKLLKYDYITGGKTGYTEKAGRTLVSSASNDDMNLIVVTIRDSDDWNTHISLYEYAFNNYKSYKILSKDKFKIPTENYYKGNFYIKNDIYLLLKKNETKSLVSHFKLEKKTNYQNDDQIGINEIYLDDKLIYEIPIYITDKEINTNTSLLDKIRNWFS